ncbi:MAG: putative 2-aminoethylphosphonate ABC transporter substrate-binding protein [SAR324 cluster bacterium]|nr:putative 2-aminoethylphosphonate ABC transporter substrate-binding protein [SAR324 cluster bacterium]
MAIVYLLTGLQPGEDAPVTESEKVEPYTETELIVYTAVEQDDLKRYSEAFNEDHPEIQVRWIQDSTGIITNRLIAEKKHPQADVVWGLSAISLMVLKEQDLLQPYAPRGVEKLDKKFVDPSAEIAWTGMDAWVATICYHPETLTGKGLTPPHSWQDLADARFEGLITMPNPVSSGTGFMNVSAWLQIFGEEKGWEFMDALHRNIGWYTRSGSMPCQLVASGAIAIGVSFAYRGAQLKATGVPIELITPTEGVGWDMEASAIIRGTSKLEAAKVLMDWSVSEKANALYNQNYAVIAMPGLAKPVPGYPENIQAAMIKNDFQYAAQNRKSILEEWQRRYGAKTQVE